MSDLAPRTGRPVSRRAKEQRAYRLVVAGGAAGAVAVVGLVLAVIGLIGFIVPVLAAVGVILAVLLFRRTVSS